MLSGTFNSFVSCIKEWQRYSQGIKVPAAVVRKNIPELADFIRCLKEIAHDNVLSEEKRELFLDEITQKAAEIAEMRSKQLQIYRDVYSGYTHGLSDDDVISVMSSMPTSSFLDGDSEFETRLKTKTDSCRQEQEQSKLKRMWRELTNSSSPMEWSSVHKTPISVLLSAKEEEKAGQLFNALSVNNPDIKSVTHALEFLSSEPEFIKKMNDKEEIDDAFREKLIGRYSAVIYDCDAVREHILSMIKLHPYNWYGNGSVQSIITKYATSMYRTSANKGVMDRIDDMSPEEAKRYLKELVKDDVEVGISIITKGGD